MCAPAVPGEHRGAPSTRCEEPLTGGMTNAEIGTAPSISPITVRNHLSSISAELQVSTRGQAVTRARSRGSDQVC